MKKSIHTTFTQYLIETKQVNKYTIDKKQLYVDDVMVSETGFRIQVPDKWFDEKYVTIFDLETKVKYRGNGYAKYLLKQLFDYVKKSLELNIITLIVYKNNTTAVNLYFKIGFEVYEEYDDCYSLIKNL